MQLRLWKKIFISILAAAAAFTACNTAVEPDYGYEIKDGEAFVKSSTCHDGTCMKKGSISKAGQTVLCAPAGVLLRVICRDGGDYDASAG